MGKWNRTQITATGRETVTAKSRLSIAKLLKVVFSKETPLVVSWMAQEERGPPQRS